MTVDNTNRHFKGQQRNETVVYFTRKHWIVTVGLLMEAIVIGAVLTALIGLFFISGPEAKATLHDYKWVVLAGVVLLTVWMNYFAIRFLNYFLDIVIVTNFRIINLDKTLYLRNDRDVVDLHEIQDIKKTQRGILPNLLNYGKLVVIVPTMIEPMTLPHVPNPDKFFRKVNNAKRDYIHHRQQQRLKAMEGRHQEQVQPTQQAYGMTTG